MTTAESYDTEVLPVRRRPRLAPLTAGLALAAVAGAAFIGGVEVQKHEGGGSASAATGSSARGAFASAGAGAGARRFGAAGGGGGFRGGAFGGGTFSGRGGFAGGGGATAGLVTLIRGSTLYVTDFTGNTVKVRTAPGLQVSKTVTTSLKGIHPGDSVVVRGTKQKDGSYRAGAVTIAQTS